ncbi:MAG: hypothetical protein VB081_06805 [Christensenella sp.]|uniref:hypothetical protein n=1 Tax=Christensenella sp. TaxID=1935934 RepID=UPI002B210BFA|nr:hypothetical protein [Christensenella sp.]MEA5003193.1 hypothetical protein [Christensenella sp.]
MKRIIKYVLVALIAVAVVVACAMLPPYLAKKNDQLFLGKINKDTQASESYQYKASKYQKTKVLYECIEQQGDFIGVSMRRSEKSLELENETESAMSADASSKPYPDEFVSSVQLDVLDGKDAEKDAVMTQAQAEMALVREARLLQSAGAIPHFDLGKQGDYSAVQSIAFWRASDPTVSNSKFYFWQGSISNPRSGERYWLVIDDDIGKAYFMNIGYEDAQNGSANARKDWDFKELRKTADAFAAYHELVIDKAQQEVETIEFVNSLYAMTNKDYEIMTEVQSFPMYQSYRMVLKPSDIL